MCKPSKIIMRHGTSDKTIELAKRIYPDTEVVKATYEEDLLSDKEYFEDLLKFCDESDVFYLQSFNNKNWCVTQQYELEFKNLLKDWANNKIQDINNKLK